MPSLVWRKLSSCMHIINMLVYLGERERAREKDFFQLSKFFKLFKFFLNVLKLFILFNKPRLCLPIFTFVQMTLYDILLAILSYHSWLIQLIQLKLLLKERLCTFSSSDKIKYRSIEPIQTHKVALQLNWYQNIEFWEKYFISTSVNVAVGQR